MPLTPADIPNQQNSNYSTTDEVLMAILNVLTGQSSGTTLQVTYGIDIVEYTVDGNVAANTFNSAEFYNQGDDNIDINGRTLLPGQSLIINGFPGELCSQAFAYSFAGVGGNPSLIVMTKEYA